MSLASSFKVKRMMLLNLFFTEAQTPTTANAVTGLQHPGKRQGENQFAAGYN